MVGLVKLERLRGTWWGLARAKKRTADSGADRPVRPRSGGARGGWFMLAVLRFKAILKVTVVTAARDKGPDRRTLRSFAARARRHIARVNAARQLFVGRRVRHAKASGPWPTGKGHRLVSPGPGHSGQSPQRCPVAASVHRGPTVHTVLRSAARVGRAAMALAAHSAVGSPANSNQRRTPPARWELGAHLSGHQPALTPCLLRCLAWLPSI